MFNLFRKRPAPLPDYSALGVDLHSHLLPGIDDGAETVEESVDLVRRLQQLGYRKLITTPHVMSDHFPNTPAIIRGKLEEVRAALLNAGIDLPLDAAAEYLLDEQFAEKIEKDELLALPGRQVLVEMGFFAQPPQLYDDLFRLQTQGYFPILAHPERYSFLRPGDYEKLRNHGCRFQLNLLSITGHYGRTVRSRALQLLQDGQVDFLGTDLHHRGHAEELHAALADPTVIKVMTEYTFANEGFLG